MLTEKEDIALFSKLASNLFGEDERAGLAIRDREDLSKMGPKPFAY